MKAGTFWARHPSREFFDVGPFAIREDAANEAQELMKLPDQTVFEVGCMRPFEFRIPITTLVDLITKQAAEIGIQKSEKWIERVRALDATELEAGIKMLVDGWMLKHGVLPEFGHVSEITRHQVVSANQTQFVPDGPLEVRKEILQLDPCLRTGAYVYQGHVIWRGETIWRGESDDDAYSALLESGWHRHGDIYWSADGVDRRQEEV